MMAMVKLKEACLKHGKSYPKIYRHCREGHLYCEYVLGKGILVDERDVENFSYEGKYRRNDYAGFNKKYCKERDISKINVSDFRNVFDVESLKEYRLKMGISMMIISHYLNISLSGYYRMEMGERSIPDEVNAKLYRLYAREGLL